MCSNHKIVLIRVVSNREKHSIEPIRDLCMLKVIVVRVLVFVLRCNNHSSIFHIPFEHIFNEFSIQTRFVGPVSMFERIRKHDAADGDDVCTGDGVNGDPLALICSALSICWCGYGEVDV